jgi:hypothetical protein
LEAEDEEGGEGGQEQAGGEAAGAGEKAGEEPLAVFA